LGDPCRDVKKSYIAKKFEQIFLQTHVGCSETAGLLRIFEKNPCQEFKNSKFAKMLEQVLRRAMSGVQKQ
jgi:hypothetical protein